VKPGVPLSTRNAVMSFFLPSWRVFLAGGGEEDDEVGDVGVADEVLDAVDHPVAVRRDGGGLHAAQVRACAGLGHGQAVGTLARTQGSR
jgi:hypothetical protein